MAEENQSLRDVNCLGDPSVCVRKQALHRLHQRLSVSGNDESALHELGNETLIKGVLRRFGDPSEQCRSLAVSYLLGLLRVNPTPVVTLLPYIFPVVSERLPLQSLPEETLPKDRIQVEPSEEVRLLLIQLLNSLVDHAPKFIPPFASDIASIIMVSASDSCPDVLLETMVLLERFTKVMENALKPIAKQLSLVVLWLLAHKRYKIRVGALQAIHRLVLCGAHETIYDLTAFQDPNLVPIRAFYHPYVKTQYLALLATDKSPAVRKELLLTVSSWLMKLDERKQHEVRLLPYVLSGINDTDPEVQELAFRLMEEIGEQYEKENETEVKDVKQYLWEATENISTGGKQLQPLLKRRPCLGARLLVRNHFSFLLHAIDADIQAWTSETRQLSASFLHTMLFFVEDNITMHLEPLCCLLVKACAHSSIQNKILECAKVVGYFVDPSAYLAVILPQLRGEVSGNLSLQSTGRTLKVLAFLMAGSPSALLAKHLPDICSTLTEQDLVTSIDRDVNEGINGACKAMVPASGYCSEETLPLLWLILNAIAVTKFNRSWSSEVDCTLEELAKLNQYESSDQLVASYMDVLLSMLSPPELWIMRSLQPLIYCRLLQASSETSGDALNRLFLPLLIYGKSLDTSVQLSFLCVLEELVEKWSPGHIQLQPYFDTIMEQFVAPCRLTGEAKLSSVADRVSKLFTEKQHHHQPMLQAG